jgi:STE24 endopeptidase
MLIPNLFRGIGARTTEFGLGNFRTIMRPIVPLWEVIVMVLPEDGPIQIDLEAKGLGVAHEEEEGISTWRFILPREGDYEFRATASVLPLQRNRVLLILALPIVFPAAAVMVAARWARRRSGMAAEDRLYRFRRVAGGAALLSAVLSGLLFALWEVPETVVFWLNPARPKLGSLINIGVLFYPVALSILITGFLSYGLDRELRQAEWSLLEHMRGYLVTLAVLAIPILTGFLGIMVFPGAWLEWVFGAPGAGAIVATVFAGVIVLLIGLIAPYLLRLIHPTSPLREPGLLSDIRTIAEKAGVTVTEVFLMKTKRARVANAMVSGLFSRRLYLTDYLIGRLSREEILAVIAHEIGHIKKGHLLALTGLMLVMVVIIAVPLVGGARVLVRFGSLGTALVYLVALAVTTLATRLLARGFERSADRMMVRLTGDPRPAITALFKIARLNTLPLRWDRTDEPLKTHPSISGRIRLIAESEGISEGEVGSLLEKARSELEAESPGEASRG